MAALIFIMLAAAGNMLWQFIEIAQNQEIGDGQTIESYGFDLSTLLIPKTEIVAGRIPKDGRPALLNPATMTTKEADALNRGGHGKYLVSTDPVIGVSLNGESRAYPIRVMNWHEIANDLLGKQPIAVTYHPLCKSVVVFDRQLDGEILELGVSGLLYNSNLLMYDRRKDAAQESLWSQLGRRAVAGPAAKVGKRLRVLPAEVALTSWGAWRKTHPDTTVLARDPVWKKQYKTHPFRIYQENDELMFPIKKLPAPPPGIALKTPLVIVGINEKYKAFPFPEIAQKTDDSGIWKTVFGDQKLSFHYQKDLNMVSAVSLNAGEAPEILYAFWFAWQATQNPADFITLEK